MTPTPINSAVNDEGGNPICDVVGLLKDLLNSHHDGKVEKVLGITEDQIGI